MKHFFQKTLNLKLIGLLVHHLGKFSNNLFILIIILLIYLLISDPDPLIGLTILEDIQLCYSAFMLSSTYGFVYHELSARKSLKPYNDILLNEELSPKRAFDLPKINPIPETLTRFLDNQGLSRQPKMVSSRNQQNNQEKPSYDIDIEFLHTVMGNIQKDVYELKEAAMALQKR